MDNCILNNHQLRNVFPFEYDVYVCMCISSFRVLFSEVIFMTYCWGEVDIQVHLRVVLTMGTYHALCPPQFHPVTDRCTWHLTVVLNFENLRILSFDTEGQD
jgi:hypothetical protein